MRHFLGLTLMLLAIAGSPSSTKPTSNPSDFQSLVGHRVHLEGRFGGPGKLADYVTVPGGQIYLTGRVDSGGREIEYGTTISVDGILGYRSYPPSTQPEGETPVARPPDHFYIDNAKVRVLRRPGGTSEPPAPAGRGCG